MKKIIMSILVYFITCIGCCSFAYVNCNFTAEGGENTIFYVPVSDCTPATDNEGTPIEGKYVAKDVVMKGRQNVSTIHTSVGEEVNIGGKEYVKYEIDTPTNKKVYNIIINGDYSDLILGDNVLSVEDIQGLDPINFIDKEGKIDGVNASDAKDPNKLPTRSAKKSSGDGDRGGEGGNGGGGDSGGGDSGDDGNKNEGTENQYNSTLNGVELKISEQTKAGGTSYIIELVKDIVGYAINLLIFVGVGVAMFGGYKIMSSDDEKVVKEGVMMVTAGIIGIIIMVSAKFMSYTIIELMQENVENKLKGMELAKDLYEKLLYPFIKLLLYFVVGILFFIMAVKIISFVTSTDDAAKKKAAGIIIRTVVGILVILGSKQIVEAVMGKQNEVLTSGDDIRKMGLGILEVDFDNVPIVYNVMNWIMGLSMFIVLVLIIVQSYRMIAKPYDTNNRETLKKTILYVIIGVLVIGATYVISNALTITG